MQRAPGFLQPKRRLLQAAPTPVLGILAQRARHRGTSRNQPTIAGRQQLGCRNRGFRGAQVAGMLNVSVGNQLLGAHIDTVDAPDPSSGVWSISGPREVGASNIGGLGAGLLDPAESSVRWNRADSRRRSIQPPSNLAHQKAGAIRLPSRIRSSAPRSWVTAPDRLRQADPRRARPLGAQLAQFAARSKAARTSGHLLAKVARTDARPKACRRAGRGDVILPGQGRSTTGSEDDPP